MKDLLWNMYHLFNKWKNKVKTFKNHLANIWLVHQEYQKLKRQKGTDKQFELSKGRLFIHDKYNPPGVMSGHYFHQDLHVARLIYENAPAKHLDIGSRIDGFVAHLAVFREVEILDIRPPNHTVKNIHFRQADLMNLPEDLINQYTSISSLHAIEHFGLGRYGDPIDYWGYQKALDHISQLLKKNGKFYFSVPFGRQRIEFNAHRIFSLEFLVDLLKNDYIIQSFSYVDDNGNFHENIPLDEISTKANLHCRYGCSIFELIKKS